MAHDTVAAERVTEIVSLLRPERPRRLPESLAAAAVAGDIERMALFADASLEQRTLGYTTPLIGACAHNQIEAARWLIARGAAIDAPGETFTPAQSALSKGYCAMAAVLLDAGLPVERAAWGAIAAAGLGRLDMLHWLVGRGLDLDARYPGLGVLRERALKGVKEGADDVRRYLQGELDPGPPPAAPPPDPRRPAPPPRAPEDARPALIDEAVGLVRKAGRAAGSWNAVGPSAPNLRQTLIAFAASTGIAEIVAALLDAGASPDRVPIGTPPPLTAAAGEAEIDVVRLLLDRGASPDGPDGKSWLPLASAAQSGDPQVVSLLLAAGAKRKARPSGGPKLVDYARGPFAAEIRAMLQAEPPKKPKQAKQPK